MKICKYYLQIACKPLILLDFSKPYNFTPTKIVSIGIERSSYRNDFLLTIHFQEVTLTYGITDGIKG